MNAVSAPSRMSPDWIRCPPNQTTPTEDRLTTSMISGIIPATSSADRRLFRVRSLLAPSKRRISCPWRTKPRMTLAPMICSRSTRLIRSMSSWPCR